MDPRLHGDDAAAWIFEPGIQVEAMTAYVYILASRPRGTLYVGVTNDLVRRVYAHRTGAVEGFTKKYGVHRLVYFELFDDIENAIAREKCIKRWNRSWKVQAIEEKNLHWEDLYELVCR